MRILMLGWEFPPFISGGLGTACYGLTRALDRLGHKVLFVLPKAVDGHHASHVDLISPERGAPDAVTLRAPDGTLLHGPADAAPGDLGAMHYRLKQFSNVEFMGVPSQVLTPYREGVPGINVSALRGSLDKRAIEALRAAGIDVPQEWDHELLGQPEQSKRPLGGDYSGDVIGAAQTYAQLVMRLCRNQKFDVVHAHDWMTYPAGMAIARVTGKPFVAHIHSTEFDRSGDHVHQRVYDLERRGMHAAIRVLAVSMYTKGIVTQRYGVDPSKVHVIYNGIETEQFPASGEQTIGSRDKIVLFLGRITMQKGPEYFIAAAKKVLEKVANVKFIVAGSGDMDRRMIELAAEMGIGHKVLFTGFLRGKDVARVFRMADCYVMPSVSEPFGIAPLEAISHDTPVIISKQSGVSEVLTHALKVDFWDIHEMANKIVAVLKHPPLSQTLREHGQFEVRRLTWEGAAEKCLQAYGEAVDSMTKLTQRVPVGV
ncbi:MAG: glycosyltransferase family 4 protein [Planctomycetes bacterium]|nr:glycosyltransferase family 4 protein [Planctomycetota bacterium]